MRCAPPNPKSQKGKNRKKEEEKEGAGWLPWLGSAGWVWLWLIGSRAARGPERPPTPRDAAANPRVICLCARGPPRRHSPALGGRSAAVSQKPTERASVRCLSLWWAGLASIFLPFFARPAVQQHSIHPTQPCPAQPSPLLLPISPTLRRLTSPTMQSFQLHLLRRGPGAMAATAASTMTTMTTATAARPAAAAASWVAARRARRGAFGARFTEILRWRYSSC